jgi:hypothetical protein
MLGLRGSDSVAFHMAAVYHDALLVHAVGGDSRVQEILCIRCVHSWCYNLLLLVLVHVCSLTAVAGKGLANFVALLGSFSHCEGITGKGFTVHGSHSIIMLSSSRLQSNSSSRDNYSRRAI